MYKRQVQGTYPNSTYTGGSADKNVSYTVTNADEYPNYDITISGSPKGTVTQKTATVEIINQPKFVTDTTRPQHGDKLGTDGLNGFEYTVSYSDGTTTKPVSYTHLDVYKRQILQYQKSHSQLRFLQIRIAWL